MNDKQKQEFFKLLGKYDKNKELLLLQINDVIGILKYYSFDDIHIESITGKKIQAIQKATNKTWQEVKAIYEEVTG